MAESYFELLTEQRGLPVKPFDPLEELRCLRRRLALRIQNLEFTGESDLLPLRDELGTKKAPTPEPISLETVVNQVSAMKKTLVIWQRSRFRAKQPRGNIFRSHQRVLNKKRGSAMLAQYLDTPREGVLETLHAGLMALGVIGVVFGALSYYRGWESDLSLGSLVCASGATVVAIGTAGLLFASRCDLSTSK